MGTTTHRTTMIDLAAINDPNAEAVAETMRALTAAVGQARLYGLDHEYTTDSLTRFVHYINEVTAELGPIELTSALDGLRWRGLRVTHEGEEHRAIGNHLHREGVARIRFAPGVSFDEAYQLIYVLGINLSLPEYEEETLASLLWQSEFASIEFEPVKALMDAEALSGRAAQSEAKNDAEEMIRELLELRVSAESGERPNLAQMVGQDQIHRAVSENDLAMEGAEDPSSPRAEQEWQQLFDAPSEDDARALEGIRTALRVERPSELYARLFLLLLNASVARRKEMPPEEALGFAEDTIEALYESGDPFGVLAILEEADAFLHRLAHHEPAAADYLRRFLDQTLSPIRVAGLIKQLNPNDPADRTVMVPLLNILPPEALIALLQWSEENHTEDAELQDAFFYAIGESGGPKLYGFLDQAHRLPKDQVIPLIRMYRLVGDREARTHRRKLLGRPSTEIRVAVLEWFMDDLPNEDLGLVVDAVMERNPRIRDAAIDVLDIHRPPAAASILREVIEGDEFASLERNLRIDLCVAYARVERDRALPLLESLLRTRIPLFNRDSVMPTIEAAAMGLAAVGTPEALQLLRKEKASLFSSRSNACESALATAEDIVDG